jgi:hypothetical protein
MDTQALLIVQLQETSLKLNLGIQTIITGLEVNKIFKLTIALKLPSEPVIIMTTEYNYNRALL